MDYLVHAPARLVAVGGFSGTGKSTLAAALAPPLGRSPGALHLRSDLERKTLLQAGETERLPASAYTPEVSHRVYARLYERAGAALSAGHSVIVDAVFSTPDERAAIETVATAAGAPFMGLWLWAPAAVLRERVERRTGDASDATGAVVAEQLARGAGSVPWRRIDASGAAHATWKAACQALVGAWG
jgi:predicted kinase